MSSSDYPDDRLYHLENLWIRKLETGTRAIIGVSHFAQDQLGDIVSISLPSVGHRISCGTAFGSIEAAKVASDLIAPVDGTVVSCNADLEADPTLVNSDCNEAGWLIHVDLDGELDQAMLLTAQDYKSHVGADD